MRAFKFIVNYLKEVRVEARKVNWPNRETTISFTLAVIAVSIFVGIFLGGLDYFFLAILKRII